MITNIFGVMVVTLLLCGCCQDGTEPECTAAEKAQIDEVRTPVFITQKDGVNLYAVQATRFGQIIYFTTPCGDVSWTTREGGKVKHDVPHSVNGLGCKP